MKTTINLQPLMCRASEAAYKRYLQKAYGIRMCEGDLDDEELDELWDNIDILTYISKNYTCDCDTEKLIETLK